MKWIWPEENNSDFIDVILKNRNINNKEEFFNPKLEDIYSTSQFYDLDNAAKFISEYIKENKKIYIHGDFDADGVCATAILWNFLYYELKANVVPFIPNRFSEGYGLSEETVKKIIDEGGDLIITVDCGVKDLNLVAKYSDKIKFIITDHHTLLKDKDKDEDKNNDKKENRMKAKNVGKEVNGYIVSSKASAVVHPKLSDIPFNEICGTAVSWFLVKALAEINQTNFDVYDYLDLVAIGTICDIMPLMGQNRTFVKYGLEKMAKTKNVGLKVLLRSLNIKGQIDPYHIGFVIGPRLNAAGRLESALDALRLLTTKSEKFALEIVKKLEDLNSQRQTLTMQYLTESEKLVKHDENKIKIIIGDNWPEGILGLIAGKLTERYHLPVIVGSRLPDKIKASARSIEEFHISNNLKVVSTLLLAHGGHAQAAGLSIDLSKEQEFYDSFVEIANKELKGKDISKKLKIDFELLYSALSFDILDAIDSFKPFGFGNTKPVFGVKNLTLKSYKVFGKENNHISLTFSDGQNLLIAVAFNKSVKDFGLEIGKIYNLAGGLELDKYSNSIRMLVSDIQTASFS